MKLACCIALFTAASAHAACPPDAPHLLIAAAGSLTSSFTPVQKAFTERTGVCVDLITGGSVKLARELVTPQGRAVDIFASADAEVNERMLVPAHLTGHVIRFARGAMVLAYTSASRQAATIAVDGVVAPDWTAQLLASDARIGGSHPFLDPGGYRADMIFQLAQLSSGQPGLYNALLDRSVVSRKGDVLGSSVDYQFTYEHSARAAQAADKTGAYRYARLPDNIAMAVPLRGPLAAAGVTMAGVDGVTPVRIPASRVTWGLSIMAKAPHAALAEQFLQLFFSPEGLALRAAGPTPIAPPQVPANEMASLPAALRTIVQVH
jgi:ABC-type molybdate transport system substrate-binding protein